MAADTCDSGGSLSHGPSSSPLPRLPHEDIFSGLLVQEAMWDKSSLDNWIGGEIGKEEKI